MSVPKILRAIRLNDNKFIVFYKYDDKNQNYLNKDGQNRIYLLKIK